MNIYQIIKKPIISEKSYMLAEKGKYSFIVDRSASKYQIIEAFKKIYSVDVISINILNLQEKSKTTRTKKGVFKSVRPKYKKAIISIKKDQKIGDFEAKK